MGTALLRPGITEQGSGLRNHRACSTCAQPSPATPAPRLRPTCPSFPLSSSLAKTFCSRFCFDIYPPPLHQSLAHVPVLIPPPVPSRPVPSPPPTAGLLGLCLLIEVSGFILTAARIDRPLAIRPTNASLIPPLLLGNVPSLSLYLSLCHMHTPHKCAHGEKRPQGC